MRTLPFTSCGKSCRRIAAPRHVPHHRNSVLGGNCQQPRAPVRCRATYSYDDETTISELQQLLDAAVDQEDYDQAALLRDALKQKQIDNKLSVEDANRAFYAAFNSGDVKQMEAVWGKGDHVQCTHPGAECIDGRDLVMEGWKVILSSVRPRAFRVDIEDVRIYATETHGYVTCVEVVDSDESAGRVAATNIFEKQAGSWKIVHHHGGPLPVIVRRSSRR